MRARARARPSAGASPRELLLREIARGQAVAAKLRVQLAGETLRQARHAMDRMLGNVATEDMLDALFGRFCIGK